MNVLDLQGWVTVFIDLRTSNELNYTDGPDTWANSYD